MPVVVTADFPGVSAELYIKPHTSIMSEGRPDGMISHCCYENGNRFSVVDVWESKEKLQAFVEDRITSAAQKHGIEGGPENLEITDLVNVDAFDYQAAILSNQ